MNKKLLALLIAVIPTLMPNLAAAMAIELPPEVGGTKDIIDGQSKTIMIGE